MHLGGKCVLLREVASLVQECCGVGVPLCEYTTLRMQDLTGCELALQDSLLSQQVIIVLWNSELLQFLQDGFSEPTRCTRGGWRSWLCSMYMYVVGNLKENFKSDTPNENKDKSNCSMHRKHMFLTVTGL